MAGNVYKYDMSTISVLNNIYTSLSQGRFAARPMPFASGSGSLSIVGGLSSDELDLFGSVMDASLTGYFKNDIHINQKPCRKFLFGHQCTVVFTSAILQLKRYPLLHHYHHM